MNYLQTSLMQLRLYFLLSGVCLFVFSSLSGQRIEHRQGEIIVQLTAETEVKDWIDEQLFVSGHETISPLLNIHLLRFDHDEHADQEVYRQILKQKEVVTTQFNHLTKLRSATPDDPRFNQQWQFLNTGQAGGNEGADFNILGAWDVTTGGMTPNGDEIVVCAIDNGYDSDHEDLIDNLWTNDDEIPNNGIDDDENGYIDDYHGWSTETDDNNLEGGPHGTSVAGIMGAAGNNGIGVSGTSWNVKVMMVNNGFLAAESEVLQAYSYVLEQRVAYDESNGEKGAYAVVTNASWGIDGGRPEDSPIWCGLYETLGQHGILNVAATTNTDTNVDEDGDLPTTCPSDYLISVTNLNGLDERVANAGFGAINIDLGAYGQQVFTTRNDNGYGPFCCTSAAAPHVAGAVGLLYSSPNPALGELMAADPAAAALYVKSIILDNVKPITDLEDITLTEGGLDLGLAMDALMARESSCFAPTSVMIAPGAFTLDIDWNRVASVNSVTLRYRLSGSPDWTEIADAVAPYSLAELNSCSFYEVQLISNCAEENNATEIFTIETDGCCRPPSEISFGTITSSTAIVSWNDVLAARTYTVRIRPQNAAGDWTEYPSVNNALGISDLLNCTTYDLEIKSDCDTSVTAFGSLTTFTTSGCGVCLDADYCVPAPPNNSEEWIAEVNFANRFVNSSGAAPGGYISYGELVGSEVAPGAIYPLTLTPEQASETFSEGFRVYADWDQNGFFTSGELVGTEVSTMNQPVTIDVVVPDSAPPGLPRMRVVMQFANATSACNPTVRFGEVEDYCLRVVASPGCTPPDRLTAEYLEDDESVSLSWAASLAPGGEYLLRYRRRTTMEWTEIITSDLRVVLTDFPLCDLFDAQIASLCDGIPGSFSTTVFNSCSSTDDRGIDPANWSVSPNPSKRVARLNYTGQDKLEKLTLFDLRGRIQFEKIIEPGVNNVSLELDELPAGIYLLRLRTASGLRGTKRVVKM